MRHRTDKVNPTNTDVHHAECYDRHTVKDEADIFDELGPCNGVEPNKTDYG